MARTKFSFRRLAEIGGLIIIGLIIFQGRSAFRDLSEVLKNTNVPLVIATMAIWWLTIPLSAASLACLSPKKLLKHHTRLAIIASAGVGKVIPGGVGNIGILALYLAKQRIPVKHAVATTLTNNLLGIFINTFALLVGLLVIDENLNDFINPNRLRFIWLMFGLGFMAILLLVKLHPKIFASTFRPIIKRLTKQPGKLAISLIANGGITLINVFCLWLSARAIGAPISLVEALLGLSLGVALGSLVPTPGGVAVAETGISIVLVRFGLASEEALAAAIIYRLASYWQPILPGIFAYLKLRKIQAI
jgi:glycosyltransferase 2 family protein